MGESPLILRFTLFLGNRLAGEDTPAKCRLNFALSFSVILPVYHGLIARWVLISAARISLWGGPSSGNDLARSQPSGMNLTRQQLTLVAVGVLLFLTGLGVKYWRMTHANAQVSRVEAR
jgi:hypothetical protein